MMPPIVPAWVRDYGQWLYDRNGGWAFEQPIPHKLYKYCPPERLHLLRDCTIRFSQRVVFDDERELCPDVTAFGTEEEIRAYMHFNPEFRTMPLLLKNAVIQRVLYALGWQKRLARIAQTNVKAADQFGVLCLCEEPDSKEMWESYAASTGFIIAFETSHLAFHSLCKPGRLGKVTYSDESLGTFLGSYGPEAFFRKRLKYSFEREWRVLKALHRLKSVGEQNGIPILVSRFDPACVSEILLRPESRVEQDIRVLLDVDARYGHVSMRQIDSH